VGTIRIWCPDSDIALRCRRKLQPGPLAGRISYFRAGVAVLLFFLSVFMLSTCGGTTYQASIIHSACSIFAFISACVLGGSYSIMQAFAISSVVCSMLVVSYLRAGGDLRFAVVAAGLTHTDLSQCSFVRVLSLKGSPEFAVTIGSDPYASCADADYRRIRWEESVSSPLLRKG